MFVTSGYVMDSSHSVVCVCARSRRAHHAVGLQTDASYDTLRGDDNTVVVDVRTPGEYACPEKKHMPGAVNMPLGQLETLVKTLDHSKRYVLYCVAGYRSAISTSIFRKAGLDAVDVRGGYVPVIMPWLKAHGHF
jgi:rhodanese-related sulfurtransferase